MPFKPLGKKTQKAFLLEHFGKRDSISPLEAQSLYRIRSLSRRINDLEADGHEFARDPRTDVTGQRYVRYVKLPQNEGTRFADR